MWILASTPSVHVRAIREISRLVTVVGRYSSIYYTCSCALECDGETDEKFPYVPSSRQKVASNVNPSPKGVVIGNDVFIGHNALILPNVQFDR